MNRQRFCLLALSCCHFFSLSLSLVCRLLLSMRVVVVGRWHERCWPYTIWWIFHTLLLSHWLFSRRSNVSFFFVRPIHNDHIIPCQRFAPVVVSVCYRSYLFSRLSPISFSPISADTQNPYEPIKRNTKIIGDIDSFFLPLSVVHIF